MKLTPLADNVVLKRFEAEEKTASGIILSTANKEKSALCEVVAVGPGKKDEPMTVKVGQKVLTAKFGGQEIKLDEQDYMVCKLSDILAGVE